MTYAFLALAVSVNVWFIRYASKTCEDKFGWIWLPAIVASCSWLWLWTWLRWKRRPQMFPASPIRRRLALIGLLCGTLSSLLFAGLLLSLVIWRFSIDHTAPFAVLIVFDVALGTSGVVLGFFGKGIVRAAAIFLSAVMVFAWFMVFRMRPSY